MNWIYANRSIVLFCKTIRSGGTNSMTIFARDKLCIWRKLTCSVFHTMCFSLTFHPFERLFDENSDQTVCLPDVSNICSTKFSSNRRMKRYIGKLDSVYPSWMILFLADLPSFGSDIRTSKIGDSDFDYFDADRCGRMGFICT